ncbi:hypothetical protein DPMN_040834 [Dreissena polymorpha]|uniref:BTB domain-containing protein n=1 Tax=Dreissena polymorpha TaxID=45954 RepID=A0A9D4HVK0_DREPO|nr:hypothetical protein DPMN_040834 [Dreissena polymorpha]
MSKATSETVVEQKPFEQPGEYEDEITITFENDKKLYVSKTFLSHVSPVFKAMFQGNVVGTVSESLDMTDFSMEDFLEFLLCCYPRTMTSWTVS